MPCLAVSYTHLPVTVRNLADVVDTDVPGGRLITATVASAGDYRLSVRRVDVASPKGVAPLRPSFTGRPPTSSPPVSYTHLDVYKRQAPARN